MKQIRRKHSASFKPKVALAAIKERETLSELNKCFGDNQATISIWKSEFLKHSAEVFTKGLSTSAEAFEKEREELYAKIGELEMQRDCSFWGSSDAGFFVFLWLFGKSQACETSSSSPNGI